MAHLLHYDSVIFAPTAACFKGCEHVTRGMSIGQNVVCTAKISDIYTLSLIFIRLDGVRLLRLMATLDMQIQT